MAVVSDVLRVLDGEKPLHPVRKTLTSQLMRKLWTQ
jgi:hypothetical protein